MLFYYRLPQKCVVLLLIATKVCCIYHNSVLLYYSLPQKCGTLQQKYVPENLVHFIYVPDVPVIWYKSGTKLDPPQDGDKIHRFFVIF